MKKFSLVIVIISIWLLAGCETVRMAREAQTDDGCLVGEKTITAKEAGIRLQPQIPDVNVPGGTETEVQSGILPMSMSELENIAVRYNPSVAQARQALVSAELELKAVKADYLPTVSGTINYERTTSNTDRGHQSGSTKGGYSANLDLELLVFDFGKTDASVKQAIANVTAARQNLYKAENLAIYNVRQSFFDLKKALELEIVSKLAVEQYKEHLDQTLIRKEVGVATTYDYTKAEVDWNNAILDTITASNNIEIGWANLSYYLGLAESPDYQIGEWTLTEFDLDIEGLMQKARQGDPVLASLEAKKEAASYYINKTIADLYPTLDLSMSGLLSGDSLESPLLWNYFGVGSLTQNIFDGRKNTIAIEEAVAEFRVARSQVAAREQELYRNIKQEILTSIEMKKKLDVASVVERQARENLENVNEMSSVGKASSVERTDAQVKFTEAQATVVTSKFDYWTSQAHIAYLIGL